MKLTTHFDLAEFTLSETAARRGIDNDPPPDIVVNLLALASTLERIRERLGHPIIITSGYRSPVLNAAVGGSPNSAHMQGWAADLTCPGFGPPLLVCRAIASMPGLRFDQCIHEFGRWCHLSVDPRFRLQTLTIDRRGVRQGLLP